MKKILVTGGAGFIGYHISKMLSENKENEVHIIDDLSGSLIDDEFQDLIDKENVSFYKLDLSHFDSLSKIDFSYDQVYHLAAVVGVEKVTKDPSSTIRINALSTIYLLEQMKNMRNSSKILFASSCENYAGSIKNCIAPFPTPENVPLCIEDPYNPRWSYAITKILGEIACIHYSRTYNFYATVVRYHNIYGPRMGTKHVIPQFILKLKRDSSKLEMMGGDQYRSFCYISDAAKMTINLMNNCKANDKIINVGNDKDYIKISLIGKDLAKMMDISPALIEKGAPDGSIDKRMPDLELIKQLDAYNYEVPLSQGLIDTLDWYTKYYYCVLPNV